MAHSYQSIDIASLESCSGLSSPESRNSLRIATINANSIKGKRAELAEMSHTTQADILVISETKLPSPTAQWGSNQTYTPAEVLPSSFDGSIHRPRNLNGGGVMVATRKGLIAEEVPLAAGKDGEIVCAKITLANSKPLFICACYRPPT